MNIGKKTRIAAIAGAFFALSAGSAMAAAGYATGNVNVRTGPGVGYHKVDTLHKGENVEIAQCQSGWCYVSHNGPDGWVSARYLSQSGWSVQPPPTPRKSNPSVGFSFQFGSGGSQFGFSFGNQGGWNTPTPPQPKACFYSGSNYSGKRVCVTSSQSISYVGDNWNDRVSSIRVYNGASVKMCKHANFSGFCRTTSRNEPALGPWLNNEISSVRIY